MRRCLILLKYEWFRWMISPFTYFLMAAFYAVYGFFFIMLMREYSVGTQGIPLVQNFWRCFFIPLLIMVPMLTMRQVAEKSKNGTMASLLSLPVAPWEVILSKFLATYGVYLFSWVMAGCLVLSLGFNANSVKDLSSFAAPYNIIGGFMFVALIGLFWIALGIFFSVCLSMQALAGAVTLGTMCIAFIGGRLLETHQHVFNLDFMGSLSDMLDSFTQVDAFVNGIVDTRTIVFYISSCLVCLCLASVMLERKMTR